LQEKFLGVLKIGVIGSNRGIGLILVRQLIRFRHQVYAYCRNACEELRSVRPKNIIENFDVTHQAAMRVSLRSLGSVKLDWLIHVAGLLRPVTFSSFNQSSVFEQFKVNAVGPILTVQVFLPYRAQSSKIGILTSKLGSIKQNTSGGSDGYRVSKSVLNMAGKSMSGELRPKGIALFLLHPGFVRTDMTGFRVNIDPSDSASAFIKIINAAILRDSGSFFNIDGKSFIGDRLPTCSDTMEDIKGKGEIYEAQAMAGTGYRGYY
jgi:NAD(P)-dependent dehydrogenase (short-subunit alcohol dehydrogenase family)